MAEARPGNSRFWRVPPARPYVRKADRLEATAAEMRAKYMTKAIAKAIADRKNR